MEASVESVVREIARWDGSGAEGVLPLSESGLLSRRQIARVVGLSHTLVSRLLPDYVGPSVRIFATDPRDGVVKAIDPSEVGVYGDGVQRARWRTGLPQA